MTDLTAASTPADEDILSRMRRSNAETEKFVAEQKKLMSEAAKLDRDRTLAPWQIMIAGMTAGAAFFGAGIAFIKLLGP